MTAGRLSGDRSWKHDPERAFAWFLGENALGIPFAEIARGVRSDGLRRDHRNANQDAEATLANLAALTAMSTAAAAQPSLLARFGPCKAIALECERNLPGASAQIERRRDWWLWTDLERLSIHKNHGAPVATR